MDTFHAVTKPIQYTLAGNYMFKVTTEILEQGVQYVQS